MRAFAFALFAFVISGCSTPDPLMTASTANPAQPGSNWTFEKRSDRVTDKMRSSLSLRPATAKYNITRRGFAVLSVACVDRKPTVMVVFDFPVGTTGVATLDYRFDAKPGRQPRTEFLNMKAPIIRDANDATAFLSDALDSSNLYIRVSGPTGISEAEFATSGGREAIEQFESSCGSEHA